MTYTFDHLILKNHILMTVGKMSEELRDLEDFLDRVEVPWCETSQAVKKQLIDLRENLNSYNELLKDIQI